jgi:serine/threonine protein kinase
LLDAVLDLPRADRRAFLERECPDDPALRTEVLEILEAGEGPAPLLDRPAAQVAAVVSEVTGETRVPMPDRVGPYRIERVIGEGGMGTVFLAHRDDGHFDQQVALKLVRRGPHLDSRVVRRFREERQILAALSHPDIARLLDGGIAEDGLPFFAMEYVEGEAITKYCDRRSLGIEERLSLFVRVCDALAHAHEKQIVHRDVKPSNILVTTEGHPRLLDFGIAKLLVPDHESPGTAISRRSERLLTPEYASPEQIKGEPSASLRTCTASACCCTSFSPGSGRSAARNERRTSWSARCWRRTPPVRRQCSASRSDAG